jgi:hypothetical protein
MAFGFRNFKFENHPRINRLLVCDGIRNSLEELLQGLANFPIRHTRHAADITHRPWSVIAAKRRIRQTFAL